MSKSENGTVPAARLCHVVKQENFDGYGFNLHAEKGKPGQYIGKVDDGSPAEAAGLKQGDRILEVNGNSILNETHKQVVQRIKAIANEVQLLVIDPTAPPPSATKDTKDTNDHKSIESSTKTMEMEKINNGSPSDSPIVEQKPQSSSSPISNHESDTLAKSIESPIEIKIDSVPDLINNESSLESVSTTDNHDSHSIPDSPTPSGTKNSSNSATITTTDSPSTTIPTLPASTTTTTTTTKTEGLNLNMTAAELRAKLAARKKFDPKNDSVDLRKKFEIIQKL